MIRAATSTGWILIKHPDHAKIAGDFASAWGNELFEKPEPFEHVLYGTAHHDDGWIARDASPVLTPEGKPEAFTGALVGAYSAFEEIDLPNYLRVRGQATAAVAEKDAFGGIIVSMHTVNLLTEQADLETIRPEHRPVHAEFIASQRAWQAETAAKIGATQESLQRGFEFLQCCDNLSLIVCSGLDQARDLRHSHPDKSGKRHTIHCAPAGTDTYKLSPWPLGTQELKLEIPYREIPNEVCASLESYRAAVAAAPYKTKVVTLIAG